MVEVKFYNEIDEKLLKFAVIVSRFRDQWVFCKHKLRTTYEVPGGHREEKEEILATAKRELYEETGAIEYDLKPICIYSVRGKDESIRNEDETFGMLYFAQITSFGELPDSEMERVDFFDEIPEKLTYPLIQPKLMEKVISSI